MSVKVLQRELAQLTEQIVSVGAFAEKQMRLAMQALFANDRQLAEEVVGKDEELDRLEVKLEEECLKLLALHQPFASDLRFIIAVLKMNNDLERIGDLAVDIAWRALRLSEIRTMELPPEIDEMAKKAKLMVKKSLLSLIERNSDIAYDVLKADAELDRLNDRVFRMVLDRLCSAGIDAEEQLVHMIIARRLERIGDHATNIAEDVIYITTGEIVRHG